MKRGVVYTAAILYLGLLYVTDSCNVQIVVTGSPSNITSPGYPAWYPRNLTCWWQVVAADSDNNVVVDVVDSEIGSPCNYNNLTMYDGFSSLAPKITRLCGTQRGSYRSTGRSLYILFQTDVLPNFGNTGFALKVHQSKLTTARDPLCGPSSMSALTSAQILTSPNWPFNYRSNEDCIWTLTARHSFMMVRTEVLDSQLEDTNVCSYDYVRVYDGDSVTANIIQIWCGLMVPTVQSSGGAMTLKFHSDGSRVYKGFKLKYYETSVSYTCGGTLTANSATGQVITSPGYIYPGHYQNNMNCIWIISTIFGNIKLTVLDSSMAASTSCLYDYLQIYDGSSTASSLSAGRFCGTDKPTYFSSGNSVILNFVADTLHPHRGFKIKFTGGFISVCEEKDLDAYSTATDYITSPNYPLNYPNNVDCTWRISTVGDPFVVSIDVLTSNVEFSAVCSEDYVEAFDGFVDTAKSLGRWCGTDLPSKHSSGQHMFIKFHTDGSITNSGFKLSFTARDSDSFPDLDSMNVGAVAGGTVGGFIFLVMIIVTIVAIANSKPSRTMATRVQDRRAPGNIPTVNQGFQPPPPYHQVVSGEYSRVAGMTGPPPNYYPPVGATTATGQSIPHPSNAPTGVTTRVAGPPTAHTSNTQTEINNGTSPAQSGFNTGIEGQSALPAPTTSPVPATTQTQQTHYPQQGVTSDTAPIVSQEEVS